MLANLEITFASWLEASPLNQTVDLGATSDSSTTMRKNFKTRIVFFFAEKIEVVIMVVPLAVSGLGIKVLCSDGLSKVNSKKAS